MSRVRRHLLWRKKEIGSSREGSSLYNRNDRNTFDLLARPVAFTPPMNLNFLCIRMLVPLVCFYLVVEVSTLKV